MQSIDDWHILNHDKQWTTIISTIEDNWTQQLRKVTMGTTQLTLYNIWDLSLENSVDSYLCFQLALLHSVSYFFFIYQSHSLSLCTVFDSVLSNRDDVLWINPFANVFVFGDFNVHHKDWLTYSGGTDRPGELCYNFSISNDLTQMVNFPTQIPDCDSHSLALLDLFISSDVG